MVISTKTQGKKKNLILVFSLEEYEMNLNDFELQIVLQSVRTERVKAEKDFEEAIKNVTSVKRFENDEKNSMCVVCGVAETLEVLQRFNNLIIKLENEAKKRRFY